MTTRGAFGPETSYIGGLDGPDHWPARHSFVSVALGCTFATTPKAACTGMMLPSVVSAMAATSCLVQMQVPSAYLIHALRLHVSGSETDNGIIGDRVPVGTSVSRRVSARPDPPSCRLRVIGGFDAHAAAVSIRLKRNSVPSCHMRCRITPMRRARATVARLLPRRLATFHAHAVSQLGRPRFNITMAA